MTRVALCWIAAAMCLATAFTFRVIVPWLVNLQNDGAIIAAFLVTGGILTADYLLWKNLSPLWDEQEGPQ